MSPSAWHQPSFGITALYFTFCGAFFISFLWPRNLSTNIPQTTELCWGCRSSDSFLLKCTSVLAPWYAVFYFACCISLGFRRHPGMWSVVIFAHYFLLRLIADPVPLPQTCCRLIRCRCAIFSSCNWIYGDCRGHHIMAVFRTQSSDWHWSMFTLTQYVPLSIH